MNLQILNALKCPVCGAYMQIVNDGKTLACRSKKPHTFDFARKGYVHLAPFHKPGGDDRDMVRARTAFLGAGYYQNVRDAILKTLRTYLPNGGTVVDAGCGEGYYSNFFAEGGYRVFGADLSKAAVEYAAGSAKLQPTAKENALFAVAGIYDLPLQAAIADAVVSIFAPVAEEEFLRILKPGGILIAVGAGPRHLMGLKRLLYNNPYENMPREDYPRGMARESATTVTETVTVEGNESVLALFSMTPYYWRTGDEDRKKLNNVTSLTTEIDITLHVFRKDKPL